MIDWELEKSKEDTLSHREQVSKLLRKISDELRDRARTHDESKLHEPELPAFAEWGPKLKEMEYGTPEYKEALGHIREVVQHHYKHNRHHPEYFENGIAGMNLVDLIEMFCDWKAASLRMKDGGDFLQSLSINKARFSIEPALYEILYNTIEVFKER
jgi:hypothetical protein